MWLSCERLDGSLVLTGGALPDLSDPKFICLVRLRPFQLWCYSFFCASFLLCENQLGEHIGHFRTNLSVLGAH